MKHIFWLKRTRLSFYPALFIPFSGRVRWRDWHHSQWYQPSHLTLLSGFPKLCFNYVCANAMVLRVSQKINAGRGIIFFTQSGDRLCFPETVCVFSSLLQGLGETLAQGEEVKSSLDLLLLLLWERVQLQQDNTSKDILLYNLPQEVWLSHSSMSQLNAYSQIYPFHYTSAWKTGQDIFNLMCGNFWFKYANHWIIHYELLIFNH